MRRKRQSLLCLLLLVAAALCGCRSGSDTNGDNGELTKGQWIGLLGDQFGYNAFEHEGDIYSDVGSDAEYYNEIQACAEWEILPETGILHPEEGATWQYAIETSVRAIGLDKLNQSDAGMDVTEDNLVEFFTGKIANVDEVNLDTALSETDAVLILGYAYDYASNLNLQEKMEYTYRDGVREAPADAFTLKEDGITAAVNDGSSYEVGDVIYMEPTETSRANAIRIQSVQGNEVTYESAGIEDVYEELRVTGTFEGNMLYVETAEDVRVSMVESTEGQMFGYADYSPDSEMMSGKNTSENKTISAGLTLDKNSVRFDKDFGNGAAFSVDISDIRVTADVDFKLMTGLKKADVTVSFEDKVKLEYTTEHLKDRLSRQIPLGSVLMPLGTTPLTVKFDLVANIGLDGEASITYTSKVVANVNYQKGNGLAKSVSNRDAECDFHAQVTATVEPSIKADLCFLSMGSLTNVKVTSGVVAIATVDADILSDEPVCVDLYMYVPLRWAVNEDSCAMTIVSKKLQVSGKVWDSDSSPINKRFHWEDGQLVDACTRGTAKVETDVVDETGVPYDEYKIFDFEEVVFGFIKVASQNLYLSGEESISVGILSLPSGYHTGELIYSSEDLSVCTVNGGIVTAVGPGSTTVRISTPDEKYSVYLSVVVEAEYNDTSDFQPL